MHDYEIKGLLVEDDPAVARLLREMLKTEAAPFELVQMSHLGDALQHLGDERFDVILLDLSLPDSHGLETFTKVYQHAPQTPIVVLTGLDDETVASQAVRQGAQDYLRKGEINGRSLVRAIRFAVERHRVTTALTQDLQAQLSEKAGLLSHVSHELTTPLTATHGFMRLLLEDLAGNLSPQQHESLGIALEGVDHIRLMLTDLLTATQAHTGKLTIEPRRVSLLDLIPEALARVKSRAMEKQLTLAFEVPSLLPPVNADPERLQQVLIHLLDNAIKFTPELGRITVQAAPDANPDVVCIKVHDTGCGISPEGLPRIFERLYREDSPVGGDRKGLGLGLYICQELVSLHGGHIEVDSELGRGSTFAVTLPVFPLAKLLSPIIAYRSQISGPIVLMTVKVFVPNRSLPIRDVETLLEQAWSTIQRCILHDRDVLLPRMARMWQGEAFCIMACTDRIGAQMLGERIRAREPFSQHGGDDDLKLWVRATMIDLPSLQERREDVAAADLAACITTAIETEMGRMSGSSTTKIVWSTDGARRL
ncbi:MAG TPA: hybrid sensor histidine kinase/response regulator [Candidatus Tectomicrobia bacterium]